MGRKEALVDCSVCAEQTPHIVVTLSPLLHIVAFVLSGGLWLFVWLVLCAITHRPMCTQCGTRNYSPVRRVVQFVSGLALVASFYVFIIGYIFDLAAGWETYALSMLLISTVLYATMRLGAP